MYTLEVGLPMGTRVTGGVGRRCVWFVQTSEHSFKFQELNTYGGGYNENWLGKDPDHCSLPLYQERFVSSAYNKCSLSWSTSYLWFHVSL